VPAVARLSFAGRGKRRASSRLRSAGRQDVALDGVGFSEEVLTDPYPAYQALRDAGPAVQLSTYPVGVIGRYADVRAALIDWQSFTSAEGVAMTDEMNANMRGSVLASDPPEHDVLRGVLTEKFAPRAFGEAAR
jgi:cytochrome P450